MNDKILWDIIDGLRDELNIAQDGITDLNDVVKDLQAEAIEQIKDNKRLRKENAVAVADERVIKELQAEVRELQADKMKHILAYDTLQAEYNSLKAELDKEKEFAIETSIKNDRLMSQVGSISSNSSSTHTHTIKKEIAEYMENNDTCKDARMFLLPIEEFSSGVHNCGIDWDDGME